MLLLQFIGWLLFSCILMSFIEHQVHSQLMHKRNYLSSRMKPFKRMLESHAVLHHGTYKAIFRDDPLPPGEDKGIRLNMVEGLLEMLPIIIIIAFISPLGAVTFASVVAIHHFLWNQIHLEMHKPEERIFGNWPSYKFLARHHLLHHHYPNRNFNVVFPLADFVLGTAAKSQYSDHAEMYRLGLLTRRGATKTARSAATSTAGATATPGDSPTNASSPTATKTQIAPETVAVDRDSKQKS